LEVFLLERKWVQRRLGREVSSREIKWMREEYFVYIWRRKNQLNLIQQFNGVKKRRKKGT
jgi:hypothetical protein